MSPQVNRQKQDQENQAIKAAKEAAQKNAGEFLNFSFKYLDTSHSKFPCFHDEHEAYSNFVRRLRDLSGLKKIEVMANRSKSLRMHPIEWHKSSEKSGFGIPAEEQIVDTPYQFSLTANEHGRFHGFFITNTFYVVWLDKDHKLYPRKS